MQTTTAERSYFWQAMLRATSPEPTSSSMVASPFGRATHVGPADGKRAATMRKAVRIGNKWVGDGEPLFVIAEIGINHNGSVALAKQMVDGAVRAGCDAVKLQKRTPELCTPKEQWNVLRDTPWGTMRYIDYRHKVEFGR